MKMGDGEIVTQGGQRHIYSSVAEITTGDGEIVPQDMIFEILLLLPVTSLIRFKCLSKAWKEVISSPDFACLQYSKGCKRRRGSDGCLVDILATVEQERAALLHPYRLTLDTKKICNLQKRDDEELELQELYQPPNIRRLNCNNGKSSIFSREILLGPCWGFYCKFSRDGDKFALWNPATRETEVVPLPFAPPPTSKFYRVAYGFGACGKSDGNPSDFKFVSILYNSVVGKKILEVYSSRNKCWHSLETSVGPPCGSIYQGIIGVELNQVVHWYMKNPEVDGTTFIFTFNLGDETCGTIDLPLQVARVGWVARSYTLSTLSTMSDQYLSLIVLPDDIMHTDYADIWIMRQHAAWTKHTRVELNRQVPKMWGYWNNVDGGIVFGQDDRTEGDGFISDKYITGENFLLFVNGNVLRKLPLKEVGRLSAVNYAESLVTLNWWS